MKRIMKIVAALCSVAVAISMIPTSSVLAVTGEIWTAPLDGLDYLGGLDPMLTLSGDVDTTNTATSTNWTTPGDGWAYLEGTNIKVKSEGEVLYVKGDGALPDYTYWTEMKRPWALSTCTTVMIDDTITYIGSYSFYKMSNLKYIFIGSKTFINDDTCFDKIAYKPIMRIYGTETTTKNFGSIGVTSLQSIARYAQSNANGTCYILDNAKAATAFQNMTNPTIINVYNAGDKSAPWNSVEDNGNGGVSTTICKITTPGTSASLGVSAQLKFQGNACYEAFAAFIGDYSLASTYKITLYNGGEKVTGTTKELQYTLSIPSEYRQAGRTFKLLAIGSGTVYTYDDLDAADATITFKTDKPSTTYALIYK
jgi:hypothetical protein